MMRVFGVAISGNCYKVRLALGQLRRAHEWVEVDMMNDGTHTPEFLAMNPNAKVPVLEIEPGKHLPESDAILFYLAENTALLPSEPFARAQVLQWLFFEQYSHEPYIAVARFIVRFLEPNHPRRAELPRLRERGHQALAVMETHLGGRKFFVDDAYSIADIALYAYTHAAEEAGFDMTPYPAVRAWLKRVEATPGFVSMGA
jgi:glutathione S-transferase